jgi:hypothetical protein
MPCPGQSVALRDGSAGVAVTDRTIGPETRPVTFQFERQLTWRLGDGIGESLT